MGTAPVKLAGITPYLHYDSLLPMVEWLTRVFGFTEKGRWLNAAGIATHATLLAGSTELWLDGDPSRRPASALRRPSTSSTGCACSRSPTRRATPGGSCRRRRS